MLAARGAAGGTKATAAACIWPLLIAYTLLAWVLFGVGMAISGGSIDQAVALMAPGGSVRYVALAAIVILAVWLYVRSNRIAGLPSPIPAAPIAVALAAIALAAEFLQSQLRIALPLSSVQLVIAAAVATTILLDQGLRSGDEPEATLSPQV